MRLVVLVVPLASAGCLDWRSLYEKTCEGAACDASAGEDAALADAGMGEAVCGNGVVEPPEECDDGDAIDTDGCRTSCKWARCGDGVVRTGVEECDDGNTIDGDACTRCLACAAADNTFYWSTYSSCYEYHDIALSRDAASDFCATGSTAGLLMLDVNDEELIVEEAMRGPAEVRFWLGMARRSDGFEWLSGADLGRTFWADGEPASGKDCAIESIAAMTDAGMSARGFDWYARECDDEHAFICERKPPHIRGETNHAYFVGFHLTTWSDARARCEALGAHLATIDSEGENGAVSAATASQVWLGAEANREPREYRWVTGEPFVYEDFDPSDYADDDDTQRCLLYDDRFDGWFDKECTAKYAYLCEFD